MERAKVDESEGHTPKLEDRSSEATTRETLEDLENNEQSSSDNQGERNESDVASPDGAFDEKRETDDAGPM